MSKSVSINGHTWTCKRIRRYAYECAKYHTIYEAYKVPSENKVAAYHRCKNLMREVGGHGMMITGRNSETFSVMFQFEDRETGELYMEWITRSYDYACPLAECDY